MKCTPSDFELHEAPISISTIEYDFEEYALNYGIPETLDPLPYRKAGSVFATGEEAEPVLTSAKHDPRLRTVVCRHWLRDLCMKGAACEFLHQYDLSKMPLCRHGERCKIRDCPFRHISEESRMECAFYKSGFCIHGPFCRYKHVKRPRDDLPAVADFTLGLSQMQAGKDTLAGGATTKRPAPKPNEFYKISLCKHFAAGDCPFGEGCHFAHGEHELRTFPRKQDQGDGDELSDNIFGDPTAINAATTANPIEYFHGGAAGGGKPCPVLEPEKGRYFIIVAATQQDLAISTVRKEWFVQRKDADALNDAYHDVTAGTTRQVLIFFTVSHSRHIQGAALMTKAAIYDDEVDRIQTLRHSGETKDGESFSCRVAIEWYRTTEFPIQTALEVTKQFNDNLVFPSAQRCCVSLTWQVGNALMKALWNSPLLTLYESWEDDTDGDVPAPENILTDFRAPGGLRTFDTNGAPIPIHPNDYSFLNHSNANDSSSASTSLPLTALSWPTMPGPGFIFGCSSDTMDECLGRGIFGLPAHMQMTASFIVPGSTLFLFNVTDRLLFGIFEALTKARMNIEPTAFSKNPKATTSPFPVQVRVRVSLECPPLEDTDSILNDILRSRGRAGGGGGRIGPLSHAQTVAVASLLAYQCGALQYMQEYQRQKSQQNGSTLNIRPPPIALPPRKITIPKPQKESNNEENRDELQQEQFNSTMTE